MKRVFARHLGQSMALACLTTPTTPLHGQSAHADVHIAAQPLAGALEELSRQSGTDILFRSETVAGKKAGAVSGKMDVRQALSRMLQGTGLIYVTGASGAITITARPLPPIARRDVRPPAPAPAETDGLYSGEIVVTGVVEKTSKFKTSYAVSTLSQEQIVKSAPQSTADLIGKIPGFYAEASGGESNNNISSRGLPGTDGTRFVGLQEDGVLLFQDPNEIYLNGDTLLRLDIMTERVEAVRFGSAPIFTSNAPAGVINYITRKGGDTAQGALRVTMEDRGQRRLDGYMSGPVGGGWYYAAGGFIRTSNGPRDPGFTTDKGGQLRLNITRRFDGGEFTAYVKLIDETNVFYLPIPLTDPRDGSSLSDLIDPLRGTMLSNDNRRYDIPTFTGNQTSGFQRDLADGRHARAIMAGFEFRKALAGGWSLSNKFRYLEAAIDLDTLFSTTGLSDYRTYAANKLASAQKAFGANVVALNYRVVGSAGGESWDPATSRGLVIEQSYRYVPMTVTSAIDDFQISREIGDFGPGKHVVTAGINYSHATLQHQRFLQDSLHEIGPQRRRLDLVAVDAAGTVLGSVTDQGFLRYGSYYIGGRARSDRYALYIADNWQVNDALSLDMGFRNEWYDQTGTEWLTETRDLGDPTTMADDAAQGNSGETAVHRNKASNQAWTIGVNYEFNPRFAAFVRFTRSFRSRNVWATVTANRNPDDKITGAELGLKYNRRSFSLFATGFYSGFNRLSIYGPTVNPDTGINESAVYWGKLKVYGIEAEAVWRPVRAFELAGNLTLQRPRQRDLQESKYGNLGDAYDGKLPARVPQMVGRITPTLFFDAGRVPMSLYGTAAYTGLRYVDALNNTRLPAYTVIDLGVTARIGALDLQGTVTNATNTIGITEGNPRVDTLTGQGSDVVGFGRPIFGRTFRLVATWNF